MEIIFTTMEVTFRIHQNGEPPTAIAQKKYTALLQIPVYDRFDV